MRTINGVELYTVQEASKALGMSEKTLYNKVKSGKLRSVDMGLGILIPSHEVDRLMAGKRQRLEIVVMKSDLASDPWVGKRENVAKLSRWAGGVYTEWSAMTLEDYLSYYRYIIRPKWAKSDQSAAREYPSTKWLAKSGFRAFKEAFEIRYLERYGVPNLAAFWEIVKKIS